MCEGKRERVCACGLVGSGVMRLGAEARERIHLLLSLRSHVFIISTAQNLNASLICWSAVFWDYMLKSFTLCSLIEFDWPA